VKEAILIWFEQTRSIDIITEGPFGSRAGPLCLATHSLAQTGSEGAKPLVLQSVSEVPIGTGRTARRFHRRNLSSARVSPDLSTLPHPNELPQKTTPWSPRTPFLMNLNLQKSPGMSVNAQPV
jgi:hypothetical protein